MASRTMCGSWSKRDSPEKSQQDAVWPKMFPCLRWGRVSDDIEEDSWGEGARTPAHSYADASQIVQGDRGLEPFHSPDRQRAAGRLRHVGSTLVAYGPA